MSNLQDRLRLFWASSSEKNILIAGSLLIWAVIGVLFLTRGYEQTWSMWGFQTQSPYFQDFRLLPAMVQSLHTGFDPRLQNPSDPLQRVFNYPSIWYLLAFTGLSQADSLWAGIALLCVFFLGFFLFPGKLRLIDVVLLLLVGFSPAAMLLYERANVDLLMFFLCALAIAFVQFSTLAAAIAVGLAALLKLFPFFGVGILISRKRPGALVILGAVSILFAAYLAFSWNDLRSAWDLTMRGRVSSYGVQVFVMHFAPQVKRSFKAIGLLPAAISGVASALSYVVAAIISVPCAWLGLRSSPRLESSSPRNLDAFWLSAGIYVGTFLLGNNWDYRLVFLAFTVPQLAEWMTALTGVRRRIVWITMGLVLLTCWYLFYSQGAVGPMVDILFVIDEAANWALYALMVYLLAAAFPDGLRSAFARQPAPARV